MAVHRRASCSTDAPIVNLRVLDEPELRHQDRASSRCSGVRAATARRPCCRSFCRPSSAIRRSTSGFAVSPRGLGALTVAASSVGRLIGRVDSRAPDRDRFALAGWIGPALQPHEPGHRAAGRRLDEPPERLRRPADLRAADHDRHGDPESGEQMGQGTGIFNLMRNIGAQRRHRDGDDAPHAGHPGSPGAPGGTPHALRPGTTSSWLERRPGPSDTAGRLSRRRRRRRSGVLYRMLDQAGDAALLPRHVPDCWRCSAWHACRWSCCSGGPTPGPSPAAH